jgi:hypothetical protein
MFMQQLKKLESRKPSDGSSVTEKENDSKWHLYEYANNYEYDKSYYDKYDANYYYDGHLPTAGAEQKSGEADGSKTDDNADGADNIYPPLRLKKCGRLFSLSKERLTDENLVPLEIGDSVHTEITGEYANTPFKSVVVTAVSSFGSKQSALSYLERVLDIPPWQVDPPSADFKRLFKEGKFVRFYGYDKVMSTKRYLMNKRLRDFGITENIDVKNFEAVIANIKNEAAKDEVCLGDVTSMFVFNQMNNSREMDDRNYYIERITESVTKDYQKEMTPLLSPSAVKK